MSRADFRAPGNGKWCVLHTPPPRSPSLTASFIQRCDGIKPACQQCVRAKKADCCEYDDGKGKTRTQLLRENIARLEARIRELEDPDSVSAHPPSIQLQQRKTSGSSPSSLGSPLGTPISATHSPFPSGESASMSSHATLLNPLCNRVVKSPQDRLMDELACASSVPPF